MFLTAAFTCLSTADYQLKESGFESSSGHYHSNGWSGMRPAAAIFPSDVEEDEAQGAQLSLSQQQLRCQHRATSVSSLQQSGEESDTVLSTHSAHSWHSQGGGSGGEGVSSSSIQPSAVGLSRVGSSTLSTFHPGPTNHDRCPSRSIALPSVCGDSSGPAVTATVTATTQTPCPNCERGREGERLAERGEGVGAVQRDRCEGCVMHQHRHYSGDNNGSSSDSNAHQRPLPPVVPPRASSFSSLPTGSRPLRPVQGGGGGCCCQSVACGKHKNGLVPRAVPQQHRHNGE